MTQRLRVLVNGATGALGRATMAALHDHDVVGGTRRVSPPDGMIHVPEDGRVDPAMLHDVDIVINCVGRVDGDKAELAVANVEHLRHLAAAAQVAGVRRLVQVSSFSLYGRAEEIGSDTPIAPVSAYGRSKAEAERILDAMEGVMSTLSVRLPFLFDRERPGLLGSLVALFRRVPIFPVAATSTRRSMLTYPDAAALLADAAASDRTGAIAVADPQVFTVELLVHQMRECGFHPPMLVGIPRPIVKLVRRISPALGGRLFASSRLDPHANRATGRALPVGLEEELRALLARRREGGR